MFVGRDKELSLLESSYKSKTSELLVIYGRRRIGKSVLVEEFLKEKENAFSFEALESETTDQQIKHFTDVLREQVDDPILARVEFKTWKECFNYLTDTVLSKRTKTVLFFDEFQWMAAGQGKLISLLKYYWDKYWSKQKVMLILCGSVASFMVNRVIKSKALYGRISKEILLKGLKPSDSILLFRGKRSKEEILKYLLVFGGVPKYLRGVDLNASFSKNMNLLCFSAESYLIGEPEKIFYSQFKEAEIYRQIVRLLKDKICTFDEISKRLKFASGGGLTRYIDNLKQAEIISEFISIDMSRKSKSKKYKLTDEYLTFFFKYIEPNLESIRESDVPNLFETLCESQWKPWLGFAFERFCLKNAYYIANVMGFGDKVAQAAPYFKRNDQGFQIDLIYKRRDKVYTICEIKYSDSPIGTKIIPEFEKKFDLFSTPRGFTKERALISIHGPDKSLKDAEYFHHCVILEDILL